MVSPATAAANCDPHEQLDHAGTSTCCVVSGPLFLAQRRKESRQQPILFLCTMNFNCGRSVSNTYVTLSVVVTLRSDRLA